MRGPTCLQPTGWQLEGRHEGRQSLGGISQCGELSWRSHSPGSRRPRDCDFRWPRHGAGPIRGCWRFLVTHQRPVRAPSAGCAVDGILAERLAWLDHPRRLRRVEPKGG